MLRVLGNMGAPQSSPRGGRPRVAHVPREAEPAPLVVPLENQAGAGGVQELHFLLKTGN